MAHTMPCLGCVGKATPNCFHRQATTAVAAAAANTVYVFLRCEACKARVKIPSTGSLITQWKAAGATVTT